MKRAKLPILLTCFVAVFSVGRARADVIVTDNFTISNIVGGPFAGQTFTGTFTYDATLAAVQDVPLLGFTTNFPSWAGASLADAPGSFFGPNYFSGSPGLSFFYAPAPVGSPNAFTLGANGQPIFVYGTTLVVGSSFQNVGQGVFTFAPASVPEPPAWAMIAVEVVSLGSLLRRIYRFA